MRVLLLMLIMTCPATAQQVMDTSASNVPAEKIEELFDAIRAELRDGYSARLTDLSVSYTGAVCGKINAKNAFGAYVGNQRFGFSKGSLTYGIIPEDDPLRDLQEMTYGFMGCPFK